MARKLLGIPRSRPRPEVRRLVHSGDFAVVTEPAIQVIATTYGPGGYTMHLPDGPVVVYVGHAQNAEDVSDLPAVRGLARGRRTLIGVDPRGFGHTAAQTCSSEGFFDAYGSDYLYAATGEMLGESYLGRRVYDVLQVVDALTDAAPIDIAGRGVGSVIAAFAALLHPAIAGVTLLNYLPSYALLLEDPLANWPLSSLLRGVLTHFDLPDVYGELGDRLVLKSPWKAVI